MKRPATEGDLAQANANVARAEALVTRQYRHVMVLQKEMERAHEMLRVLLELRRQMVRHRDHVVIRLTPLQRRRLMRRIGILRG
jgi:hypothetical protein